MIIEKNNNEVHVIQVDFIFVSWNPQGNKYGISVGLYHP